MLHYTAWATCYKNADHLAVSCMHALLQARTLFIMFHQQIVSFRYKLSVFEDWLRILIERAMLENYLEWWCLMLYEKDALHCASSCHYGQSMHRCRHGKLQKFECLPLLFSTNRAAAAHCASKNVWYCGAADNVDSSSLILQHCAAANVCLLLVMQFTHYHHWLCFKVGLFSWFCMCEYYLIELIAMRIVFVHWFHCTSILHASCSLVDLVAMYVLKN